MKVYIHLIALLLSLSCSTQPNTKQPINHGKSYPLKEAFKKYWFDGTAEVSAYDLKINRYGSQRNGMATLIYVTEDFLPQVQVKANRKTSSTLPTLKLNRNSSFLTGIYPYHIMSSSFVQLGKTKPLIKSVTSVQEWCGQMYMQLNRKKDFEIKSHSYFEGEADRKLKQELVLTEDELWLQIRTQPKALPIGKQTILPGFEELLLNHREISPRMAECELKVEKRYTTYSIYYLESKRRLSIVFENEAPHRIERWEVSSPENTTPLIQANRIKTLKIPYWQLNRLGDETYRDSLGLK